MKTVRVISGSLTSLILLSLLVSGGAYWIRSTTAKKEREEARAEKQVIATVTVEHRDFELTLSAVGKLEAVKSTPVLSEISGQVVRTIPNGTHVNKGDVIIELDAPRMEREVRDFQSQYQATVEQLERQKKELAMGVEKADLSLRQAQQQLDQFNAAQKVDMENKRRQHEFSGEELKLARERYVRKERQVKEALLPATELEAAQAEIKSKEFQVEKEDKDLQLAEAQQKSDRLGKETAVQQAQSGLRRAKAAQQDEVRNLEMRVQTNKQQLDRARDQLSKATIRAPQAGLVVFTGGYGGFGRRQELSPGDNVWPGNPVATIPDLAHMQVNVELTQDQMRRVRRGLKVRVQVETAPGKVFPGEITEISQNAREQSSGFGVPTGERVFQAYVLLKDIKGVYLRPGTTSLATVIIEHLPKALVVPLECVFNRDKDKIVYVSRRGQFVPVVVELGANNEEMVVVKSGLRPGDRVAMHDTKGLGRDTSSTPGQQSGLPL